MFGIYSGYEIMSDDEDHDFADREAEESSEDGDSSSDDSEDEEDEEEGRLNCISK